MQPQILKFLIFQKYFKKIQNGEWTHVVSWHGMSPNDPTWQTWHYLQMYSLTSVLPVGYVCVIVSASNLMLLWKMDLSETLQIDGFELGLKKKLFDWRNIEKKIG